MQEVIPLKKRNVVLLLIFVSAIICVIGVFSYYSFFHTDNKFFTSVPKLITVDLVGSDRQQAITDVQTIRKIYDILNSTEFKPISHDDETKLMFSSVGGIRITPDKNDSQSIYIHGAGAIFVSESLQKQLNIDKRTCYLSKDIISKIYDIINSFIHNEVVAQTMAAVEKKHPSAENIGSPILCDLLNSYDGKETLALIKREAKDGEPLFGLFILDENYNILAEFYGEVPKTPPYTAYTVYYNNQTITFGGLGKSKWNPQTDAVTKVDITEAKIEYDKCSGYSVKPMTPLGYIFAIGQKVVPKSLSFYNSLGELQADQNDPGGVGLGMLYDDTSKEFKSIESSTIPPESNPWLKSVSFINSKIGFLSLRYEDTENKPIGTDFMKTTDEGYNWTSINKDADLYSLCFVNEKTGYAIENKGRGDERLPVLVKTTDGGLHWEQASFMGDKYPVEINCINENTIFIGASTETNGLMGGIFYESTICRSIDGGKSWILISLPGGFSGEGMSWISKSEGYILDGDQGGAGMQPKTLFYTKDGGKHWAIQAKTGGFGEKVDETSGFPLGGYGAGIKFFADGTGYIGESRGFIYKTLNMGKTFKQPVNYPGGTDSNPVPDFINKDEGYAIHVNSQLIHTIDGGKSWEVIWPKNNNLMSPK